MRSFLHPSSPRARRGRAAHAGLLAGLLAAVAATGAAAQPAADSTARPHPPAAWAWVLDGRPAAWPSGEGGPADSLPAVARRAVARLQREGHYLARLDSVRVDSLDRPSVVLYLARGPRVVVGSLRLDGIRTLDPAAVRRGFDTRPGRVLDPARLEADLDALLEQYERAGRPLAQAHVAGVRLTPEDPPRLEVVVEVVEGGPLRLVGVELVGAKRTAAGHAARVAGLHQNRPIRFGAEEVRRRLEEAELFAEVGLPEIVVSGPGEGIVRIPVKESAPGSFDLVLGFQPPAAPGRRGTIVGNGHLRLRNLFGRGRTVGLSLTRLPGLVSTFDLALADPFVLGLPLGVEAGFHGHQEDSTFGQREWRLHAGYRFFGDVETFVTLGRVNTRPGAAGLGAGGAPAVPRSDGWFTGLGLRYRRLDRAVNPRRGLLLSTALETGRKSRGAFTSGGREHEPVVLRQRRLRLEGRAYVPLLPRQVGVLGVDASALGSSSYDESDLFRFGGAATLRGYDENQLLGTGVGRALAEWRYQLDRTSYAFAFADVGAVRFAPADAGGEPRKGWRLFPGYGIGMQYGTGLGLMTVSYALNPDLGIGGGKVHVGLSLGL